MGNKTRRNKTLKTWLLAHRLLKWTKRFSNIISTLNVTTVGALAIALGVNSQIIYAQESEGNLIEEIIVTATKRNESLQEVPIAITAISADALEKAGVKDLRDLSTVAASFNLNSSQTESQGSTLRIRGVGTTGNNIGLESAVGVFLDGVYLSRPGVALGDLLDVEQIEVLRGPQGTLFGRNTSAGALNIRTRKPNTQEHEFFANATGGNFDAINIQAGASGPLLEDRLAYRLSGAWREQDGFLESSTGAESRNRDRVLLRGQLQWDISDAADLRIIADYSDVDENCCDAIILQESPAVALGSFAAAGLPADGGVQNFGFDALESFDSNASEFANPFEQWGVSAELNWALNDNVTLTYIGSYRDFRADSIQDSDFVHLNVFTVEPSAAQGFGSFDDIETTTHELRFAGDSKRLTWLIGGYFSDENIQEQQGLGLGTDFTTNTDANLTNFALAALVGPGGPANALAGVPLPTGGTFGDVLAAPNVALALAGGADFNGAFAQNNFTQDGQSWSIFTHNSLHLTDRLDLVVGLRWTDEDKDGQFEQFAASNDACLNTLANVGALTEAAAGSPLEPVVSGGIALYGAFGCFPFATPADTGIPILPVEFADAFKDEELVWTVKGVYDITEHINTYVSFTHGFKAGGFNLDSTAAVGGADPSFNSEVVDAWEIGIKSEWFDRRLRANLSWFDYDIEDFQVLEFTGVQFVTFNVPTAVTQGIDLELSGTPLPGLNFSIAYTYSDARYPDSCDGNDPNAPANVSGLCGAQLTNAPLNVLTAQAGYEGYINESMIYFLNANLRYEDERRTSTAPGLALDFQESNTKVNARVGLAHPSGLWAVEFWGNNIFDEITRNVTFNTPLRIGSRGAFLEAPRTYGITLRTAF